MKIRMDLMELQDRGLLRDVRSSLKTFEFSCDEDSNEAEERKTLTNFVGNFVSKLGHFKLFCDRWEDQEIIELFQSIRKVDEVCCGLRV